MILWWVVALNCPLAIPLTATLCWLTPNATQFLTGHTLPYLWHCHTHYTAFVSYQTRPDWTHVTATLWYTIPLLCTYQYHNALIWILELPCDFQYHAIPHHNVYPCIIPYHPVPCNTCDSWPSWYSLCLVTMVDEGDTQKTVKMCKTSYFKKGDV